MSGVTARIDWAKTPHDLGQRIIKYGRDLTPAMVAFLRDEAPKIAAQMQHEASSPLAVWRGSRGDGWCQGHKSKFRQSR